MECRRCGFPVSPKCYVSEGRFDFAARRPAKRVA